MRLDADLVMLSACETALGEELGGEGLIGLLRSFHFAYARAVAATLWSVADQPASELMVRFYHRLAQDDSPDESLHGAQLDLIRSTIELTIGDPQNPKQVPMDASAPYFWAGIQLYGDWM